MNNTTTPKSNENIITDHYLDYKEDELRIFKKKIKKSRTTLFFVSAASLILGLIQISTNGYNDGREFMYCIFISFVFLALAFLTKKEPFAALVMALIIYVGLWFLLTAVTGPQYFFKGIIAKAIIIYFIASGIPHAQEAEKLKKELKDFKK